MLKEEKDKKEQEKRMIEEYGKVGKQILDIINKNQKGTEKHSNENAEEER